MTIQSRSVNKIRQERTVYEGKYRFGGIERERVMWDEMRAKRIVQDSIGVAMQAWQDRCKTDNAEHKRIYYT